MRETVEATLVESARFQRSTVTSDNRGHIGRTWSDVGTERVRVGPTSPEEAQVLERAGVSVAVPSARLHVRHDLRVNINDRMVTDRATYQVRAVPDPGSWAVSRVVLATKED